jgi:hypothetical protein
VGTKRVDSAFIRTFPAAHQRSSQTVNLVGCLMMIFISLLSGCTTLQPMAEDAESLRNDLRSGEVVESGDKVRVVTRDGLSRLLIVTSLDQYFLKGHPEGVETVDAVVSIPIDDIVFMEGKRVSAGKTVAYTGGVTVGAAAALVIAFMIFLFTFSI